MKVLLELLFFNFIDKKLCVLVDEGYSLPNVELGNYDTINAALRLKTESVLNNDIHSHFQVNFEASKKNGNWFVSLPCICFSNYDNISDNYQWVYIDKLIIKKIDLKNNTSKNNTILMLNNQNKLITKTLVLLKEKVKSSNIPVKLLGEKFIVADIISLYEYFNIKISKQTVKNRFIETSEIIPLNEFIKYKQGKPAEQYTCNNNKIRNFNTLIGKNLVDSF